MGGGGLGKITKVVKKPFKKVVSSIKKTLKNPLSLPERFFKNGIIKPIKQAGKEALRFTARATREVFSVLSRHTGLKFFDKIGDGSYLFIMAIKSGDWRAIGAAVMVSLSILATIFSYGALSELVGASMAYALSAANISMAAINFGVSLFTLGSMHQQALAMRSLQIEWGEIGIETMADKSKWLAGGQLRNASFAGGMLFNGGGMIDPNAQAFNYAQVDIDNAFLIRTKMPYETNAGGQIFSAAFAGSNDWRPRSLLEKYYTPKNPVEVLYKDLGIIPKF